MVRKSKEEVQLLVLVKKEDDEYDGVTNDEDNTTSKGVAMKDAQTALFKEENVGDMEHSFCIKLYSTLAKSPYFYGTIKKNLSSIMDIQCVPSKGLWQVPFEAAY